MPNQLTYLGRLMVTGKELSPQHTVATPVKAMRAMSFDINNTRSIDCLMGTKDFKLLFNEDYENSTWESNQLSAGMVE